MLSGNMSNTPVRQIGAKVELYNGSTLANTFNHNGALKSFTVDRVGESNKFFGYGIGQKCNVKLIDADRELSISTANSFKLYLSLYAPYPTFNVTEVNRDEKTNELSITCYDLLQKAAAHKVSELDLSGYTVREFAEACATLLGASGMVIEGIGADETCFDTQYEEGANFEGTESIREALNAVAEATQTIYYINNADALVFKRLDINGDAKLHIEKKDYITLDSKTNRRLSTLVSATELGDNLSTTVKVYSKNMADYHRAVNPIGEAFTEIENGYVIDVSGEDYKRTSFIALDKELEAGKSYVISYDWVNVGTEEATGVACYLPDIEQYLSNGVAFTPKANTQKIGIYLQAADVGKDIQVEITNIQLEEGTAATEYVPYGYHYQSGTTQYIKDNPFWDLREDRVTLLENALAAITGLTINQFECSWRGNYLLEIGDKISLTTKDDETVISYLLDDSISYTGGLTEKTKWNYTDTNEESAANPTTIGDAIKQTYAKVDKVNKQIEMVVSENDATSEALAAIQLNLDGISASVTNVEQQTTETLASMSEEVATLKTQVDGSMSATDVEIAIKSELANGTDKITTSTGYTFNEEGLTVSKSDSEMETKITEDGMKVYKNDEEVLVANNVGVQTKNLHATTYLIIGRYSRFEDYTNTNGEARTGCFWIG